MEPRKRAEKLAKAPPDKLGAKSWEAWARKQDCFSTDDGKTCDNLVHLYCTLGNKTFEVPQKWDAVGKLT